MSPDTTIFTLASDVVTVFTLPGNVTIFVVELPAVGEPGGPLFDDPSNMPWMN